MQRDAAHSAYNAVEHAIGATIEAMVPQWTPHKGTRRRLSGRYAEKVADHARDAAGAGLMAVTQRLGVDPLDAMYEAAMEEAEWQRKALLKRLHGLELHWAD
jgi:hypothetical protein